MSYLGSEGFSFLENFNEHIWDPYEWQKAHNLVGVMHSKNRASSLYPLRNFGVFGIRGL